MLRPPARARRGGGCAFPRFAGVVLTSGRGLYVGARFLRQERGFKALFSLQFPLFNVYTRGADFVDFRVLPHGALWGGGAGTLALSPSVRVGAPARTPPSRVPFVSPVRTVRSREGRRRVLSRHVPADILLQVASVCFSDLCTREGGRSASPDCPRGKTSGGVGSFSRARVSLTRSRCERVTSSWNTSGVFVFSAAGFAS